MGSKVRHLQYNYKGILLPVRVYFERRTSSRVSLGKDAILLRVPLLCRGPLLKNQLTWMGQWLENTFGQKPEQLKRIVKVNQSLESGQPIPLFDRTLKLEIRPSRRKSIVGKIISEDGLLVLQIPNGATPNRSELANAISRCLAKAYRSHFEDMVHRINTSSFNQPIGQIRLKNNSSNWGSCSSNGNINLSTRLLMLPLKVQEYVVVHELAHLLELNHSDRYWALVESVMPDYKTSEKWLKLHGSDKVF